MFYVDEEKGLKKHIQTELEIFELVGALSLGHTLDSNKVTPIQPSTIFTPPPPPFYFLISL